MNFWRNWSFLIDFLHEEKEIDENPFREFGTSKRVRMTKKYIFGEIGHFCPSFDKEKNGENFYWRKWHFYKSFYEQTNIFGEIGYFLEFL